MFNSSPTILVQFVALLRRRNVIGARSWRILLVRGVQELMKTGGLTIVIAVSLDGADVSIVGRRCSDGPLRHLI